MHAVALYWPKALKGFWTHCKLEGFYSNRRRLLCFVHSYKASHSECVWSCMHMHANNPNTLPDQFEYVFHVKAPSTQWNDCLRKVNTPKHSQYIIFSWHHESHNLTSTCFDLYPPLPDTQRPKLSHQASSRHASHAILVQQCLPLIDELANGNIGCNKT